ncbi:MAG: MFS transporter [Zoogloeaceae bacterium]|nr:MFS transporter [Zoogloeaceae bacterium]
MPPRVERAERLQAVGGFSGGFFMVSRQIHINAPLLLKITMIFTRSFILVALINFMVMLAYYLLFIVSGPYAHESFCASPSAAGLVAGLMLVGCLAGRFMIGGILHTVGFRKILLVGIVIYTVSMLLYHVADNLPALMGVRFLSGVGVGCIGAVTTTLIAYLIPPSRIGQGIGYFSLSTILALALGPFLGILLMQYLPYHLIFLLCSGFGMISFFTAITLKIPPNATPDNPHHASASHLRNYLDCEVIPLALVVLLVATCYGALQAFLSFYARELDLAHSASFFFLIYAVVIFASRPVAGKIFDHKGANHIIYPALILTVCGFILLALTRTTPMLLLSGILLGVGIGNFQSTAQAASLKRVPKARMGQATSTFFIFLDLGIGIGPYLLGVVIPHMGYRNLFFLLAVISAVSLPAYYAAHGKKHGKNQG